MGNYSSLKATINANIKTNGNQEITGSVMNSVLTSMVNSLGAGFQIMGVAHPADNPGTPDQNVAYLAAEEGTYTHFGGLSIGDGEVAFLKYNGTWTKQVADIPNKAAFDALVSMMDVVGGSDRVLMSDEIITGKYRTTSGTIATMSVYFYSTPIHVYKGDSVVIDGVDLATSIALISEVDENNNFIALKIAGTGSALSTTWVADREMYIGISALISHLPQITLKLKGQLYRMQLELANQQQDIQDNSEAIDELNATLQEQSRNFENYSERLSADGVTTGKYRKYDIGTLANSSAYFYSNPILLHKGESIVASLDAVVDAVAVLSVVDAENNWISLIQRGATPTEVNYTATEDIYIGISALNRQRDSFVINRIATITRMQTAIDDNAAGIEQNASDVSRNTKSIQEINNSLESASYQLGADDMITGKYRVITGSLANGSVYFYTNPIKVHKGDRVVITDANIVNAVSIISEVDANNNFISVIYAGQDTVASYTFTASRDMFIGLSALTSQAGTIAIETNGVFQRLIADEVDIKDLQEVLTNTTRGLETTDVVTGKYRNVNGNLSTLNAYFYSNPIKLHKGDRIATTSEITLTPAVSLISKVDAENNFDSVLKAGSDSAEIIDYTMTEDAYIGISALNSQRTLFIIYQNGIESRIDGLVADVASVSPAADTKLPAITDNPLSSIRRDGGYGAIIRKWGIIGDSLSSGEMQCFGETSQSSSDYKLIDMYKYSSGQVFARLIGAEAYNFSNGGQTTWGWLKNQGIVHDESYIGGVGGGDWSLASQSGQEKHGYIIAMGVNDRTKIENGDYALGDVSQITTYDGTDSDIDDTTTYPKSFVRYYAGIIQRLLSIQPKAKIFCVTPLGENYAAIAQAIRDIVDHFGGNVYLLDMRTYIPEDYRVQGFNLNGHLSPMGYAYIGYVFNTYIDWIIRKNASAFRDTALIGTNYRPDFS